MSGTVDGSAATPTPVADLVRDDPALPRANGELVFTAPSEGRAFGLALVLHEHEHYEWLDFQARLITATAAAEDDPYYQRWLAALEALVVKLGLVNTTELDRRQEEFASGRRELVY